MSRRETSAKSLDIGYGVITDRTLAALRVVLSISAVVILYLDPAEPSRFAALTYAAVLAYVAYAVAVYFRTRVVGGFTWKVFHTLIWVDVLLFSVFITFNNGTNAIFFFFYLYAIIAGSSRGGTTVGLSLTVASTLLFLGLNFFIAADLQLDVARFLRRALYMGVLGYILAYWGGAESDARRKLAFLKDLSSMANPRLGVDHAIKRMLQAFMAFYQADYGVFLMRASERDVDLYRAKGMNAEVSHEPLPVEEEANFPLLKPSEAVTAAFEVRGVRGMRRFRYTAHDSETQKVTDLPPENGRNIADFLNVESFITAPLRYRGRVLGRILIGCRKDGVVGFEDALFLQQAADQIVPVIENIRMVDRLAIDAANDERRKLARTVHDRVIQPYLGLQIGLKALQRELHTAPNSTSDRGIALLDQLTLLTRDGIEELRSYIQGLRQSPAAERSLAESIRTFAQRFENATGVHVVVTDQACGLTMDDRLSVEIFQMTAEALSNVHRHTRSRNASVHLSVIDSNNLRLVVENDAGDEPGPRDFHPRSIAERAEAIGARTDVFCTTDRTLVTVEVPL
jgi:signal transduction histidine kinase